jgi:hypothetical protein
MRRSTYWMLGLFVALAATATYVRTRAPERGMSRVNFANLQADAVDRLEIAGPNPVSMKKDAGGTWRLPSGRAADAGLVSSALTSAQSIVSGDLMTEDPARFTDLEVDSEHGSHVQIFTGPTLSADFIMGKMISGGSAVRVGEAVYKVINIYNGAFGHSAGDWLEKQVVKREESAAKSLTVALRGSAPYTLLHKDDGDWDVQREGPGGATAPRRFDGQAGRMLAQSVASLRVQEILDADPGDAETGLTEAKADRFTMLFANSDPSASTDPGKLTLLIGKNKDEHTLYARLADQPDIYLVTDGLAQSLRRPLVDLQALTLMEPFDGQQVRRIRVIDGAGSVTLSRPSAQDTYKMQSTEKGKKHAELDQSKAITRAGSVRASRALGVARDQARARASIAKRQQRIEISLEEPVDPPAGASADAAAAPQATVRRTVTLAVGGPAKETEHAVYAKGTADSQIYYISNALRDSLMGMTKSFERDAMSDSISTLSPGSLTGLPASVRKQVERQLAETRRKSGARPTP